MQQPTPEEFCKMKRNRIPQLPSEIFYKVTKYSEKVSSKIIDSQMKKAFNQWEKATGFRFIQRKDDDPWQISIEFRKKDPHYDNLRERIPNRIRAYNHEFIPDLICFNDNTYWSDENEAFTKSDGQGNWVTNQYPSILASMIHEIGHWFGLDHSDDVGDFMHVHSSTTEEFSDKDIKKTREILNLGN